MLGPNGAGKTTTAGMLTTRVIPTSGTAYIGSVDVVAHPALAKQMIGVVSQQNTLDRQLTVWENLYFHGRLFGMGAAESRLEADRLLEQFHLSKWAKASVFALSGGMAQRLMVARAIFHRPAVLFLDEPTAGLDPQSRLALWEILGELNAAGQTICSPRTTWRRPTSSAAGSRSSTTAQVLALDTPAALKQIRRGRHDRHRQGARGRRTDGRRSRPRDRRASPERVRSSAASSCTSTAPSGSSRESSPRPTGSASRSSTSRSPSRRSRTCSST